jgi:hypothetical protein
MPSIVLPIMPCLLSLKISVLCITQVAALNYAYPIWSA